MQGGLRGREEREWSALHATAFRCVLEATKVAASHTPSAQRPADCGLEVAEAERSLQARGHAPPPVDREEPGLALQLEGLQRRTQPLVRVVVAVDLLMD